jgi:AcrR family transcriptional regulator
MPHTAGRRANERPGLSRERLLSGAMAIADEGGVGALTIRSLAQHLGVKPMSLYYYVANKSEILDAIVDVVFSEIDLPTAAVDWRSEIHLRASSARRVLRNHSWAIGLLESRTTPGPATLRHHDAMLGTLRGAGFSVQMTAHAYALIDAYVYGFALSEAALPFDGTESVADVAVPIIQSFAAGTYPHLIELADQHILQDGYDFGDEFDFGLDLILDALSRLLPGHAVDGPSCPSPSPNPVPVSALDARG